MRLARALACAALATVSSTAAHAEGRPGAFDFYVLALSWSPTYCSTQGSPENSRQCGEDAGFGFIVHGLWPQYEQGWPEFCAGEDAERIPSRFADDMRDIMPEPRLVFGEWRKHGTCTGLSPEGYFALTREAWESVTIPAELAEPDRDRTVGARTVEQAFVAANPGTEARRHRRLLRRRLSGGSPHLPDEGPRLPPLPRGRPQRLPPGPPGAAGGELNGNQT